MQDGFSPLLHYYKYEKERDYIVQNQKKEASEEEAQIINSTRKRDIEVDIKK